MEFSQFLESTSKRDICSAIPDDVIDFLIWKVDSIIGKLRAIFNKYGRAETDSLFPGVANPAASPRVKSYLTAVREEQLGARVVQRRAEPFFLQDLWFYLQK